jgi:hypothetical protein
MNYVLKLYKGKKLAMDLLGNIWYNIFKNKYVFKEIQDEDTIYLKEMILCA